MLTDRPLIGKARVADLERQLDDERQAHIACIEMRNEAEAERDKLKAAFRVNSLRLAPNLSHAEVDAEIARICAVGQSVIDAAKSKGT